MTPSFFSLSSGFFQNGFSTRFRGRCKGGQRVDGMAMLMRIAAGTSRRSTSTTAFVCAQIDLATASMISVEHGGKSPVLVFCQKE